MQSHFITTDCNCAVVKGAYGFDNRIFISFGQVVSNPEETTNYAALGYHYPIGNSFDLVGEAKLAVQEDTEGDKKSGPILGVELRKLVAGNLEIDAIAQHYGVGPVSMKYGANIIYDFDGGLSVGAGVLTSSLNTELDGFVRYYF